MRSITTALITALLLVGTFACSSSSDDKASPKESVTVTATPSLSEEEIKRQCSLAVAEAAPGWEDWNVSPGDWQNDPRTPEVCLGLADEVNPPAGNRAYLDAFREGLEMADDPRADQ